MSRKVRADIRNEDCKIRMRLPLATWIPLSRVGEIRLIRYDGYSASQNKKRWVEEEKYHASDLLSRA